MNLAGFHQILKHIEMYLKSQNQTLKMVFIHPLFNQIWLKHQHFPFAQGLGQMAILRAHQFAFLNADPRPKGLAHCGEVHRLA